MHPHACRLRGSNGLHLAHPDISFALFPLAPLIPLFSRVRRNARHPGSWAMHPSTSRVCCPHRQHRLHEKPPSSFVADVSHAADLTTMGQINVTAYLAPTAPRERHSLVPWSGAGEAVSRLQSSHLAHRATDTALWSLSRCAVELAANPGDSPPAWWPLVPLVSFDADRAVGHSQRFARPSSWDPTSLVCSSCIVSFCNMWVRIRLSKQGSVRK